MKLAHIKFTAIFNVAQEAGSTPITFDIGLDDEEIALSNIVQNAFISLCDGPAARIVQRQAELGNGADSWRALCNIYPNVYATKGYRTYDEHSTVEIRHV